MSFKALAWAFDQELPNPEKAVLIALAYRDSHDEPHGCFPSLARVARDCGLNRSTVVRCLKTLVSNGLVHRSPRRHHRGDRTTSWYTLPQAWVGAVCTYPGAAGTDRRGAPRLPVGAHRTTEPDSLTGSEPKTESSSARADDESVHQPDWNAIETKIEKHMLEAKALLLKKRWPEHFVNAALHYIEERCDYSGSVPSSVNYFIVAFDNLLANPCDMAQIEKRAGLRARIMPSDSELHAAAGDLVRKSEASGLPIKAILESAKDAAAPAGGSGADH